MMAAPMEGRLPKQEVRHLTVLTSILEIAYEETGPETGDPVILLHGFPYDPRCFDEVAPKLAQEGYRVIMPYLRGYGATRFRHAETMRSGQQAALSEDLIELMDVLDLERVALMGFDWGGRAACIVAAACPWRVRCLVTGGGYNIQDISKCDEPKPPEAEARLWYQYYFHSERGRAGLEADRRSLCRLLWQQWSPTWAKGMELFDATAPSFDNPDFVDVVIHSYRHRFNLVLGPPNLETWERLIAKALQPIRVPTISLCGADDGVTPAALEDMDASKFTGTYERHVLDGVGHNIPGEAPAVVTEALLRLLRSSAEIPIEERDRE